MANLQKFRQVVWEECDGEDRIFQSVFNEDSGSGERFDRPEGLDVRSDRQSGGGGALNGIILFE